MQGAQVQSLGQGTAFLHAPSVAKTKITQAGMEDGLECGVASQGSWGKK